LISDRLSELPSVSVIEMGTLTVVSGKPSAADAVDASEIRPEKRSRLQRRGIRQHRLAI